MLIRRQWVTFLVSPVSGGVCSAACFVFELQVGMLYERPLRKNDSRGAVTVFVGVHVPNVLAHVVRRVVQRLLPVHLWH